MGVAGGPWGRNWGIKVVCVNVSAWKRENIVYGSKETKYSEVQHRVIRWSRRKAQFIPKSQCLQLIKI